MLDEIVIGRHNWQEHFEAPRGYSKGLVPRSTRTHPRGCYATLGAVDFPLIARSEWSERVKDLVASQSQLSDVMLARGTPVLDQNQKGYSHTEDTEVLTVNGWVRWPDWDHRSALASVNTLTGLMEFQVPTEWHAYEYDDEMYYSTNRRLDFGVTRNHRMLVRKWDERQRTLSPNYTFQRADQLGWYVGMMAAPSGFVGTELVELAPEGSDRRYDGDDFLALLAVICSDGYAGGSDSTANLVSFCCFRPDRYHRVAALAQRVGFKEQPSRQGVWNCRDAALAAWVRSNCYLAGQPRRSPAKKAPELVKWASTRQIRHFLDFFGDRNHGEDAQNVFYSSSKRMVDDLQELHLRLGKRSTLRERGPRRAVYEATGQVIESGPSHTLMVAETDRLCVERRKHLETDHYKGLVYCATVPNGTLVTRRNGSVLISGNCWAHSSTGAVMAARAVMGEPTIGLSAYAVACIVKNFADEGGWGAQSADFIAQRGVPSEDLWPQRSMDRANDNDKTWANAALHKITGQWADLAQDEGSRDLSFDQFATLWLSRCPTVNDYNWWSHSVMGADLVDGTAERGRTRVASGKLATLAEFDEIWEMDDPVCGGWGCRIRNSWGDSYGTHGFGVLAASKAAPDGGVGIRTVTPSLT